MQVTSQTKILQNSPLSPIKYTVEDKALLEFINGLCITFCIPGVKDCLCGQCFLEQWVTRAWLSHSHTKEIYGLAELKS